MLCRKYVSYNCAEEEKDKITDEIIEAMVEPSGGCQGDAKDVTPLDEAKKPEQEESLPKVGESGDHKDSIGKHLNLSWY